VPVINKVRKSHAFDLVVFTQDWHPPNHVSFASNNDGAELFSTRSINGQNQVMWPDHCVQGSDGARLHADLVRSDLDPVVQKGTHVEHDSYSGFQDNDRVNKTELEAVLKAANITHLYICGLATDYCVSFTVIDAVDSGFAVTVLDDACRGIDPAGCDKAKAAWAEKGVTLLASDELDDF